MTLLIAPLRPDERARWGELWSGYQTFYEIEIPAEVTANTWERIQSGRVHGLGARDSSHALVGIVHYLFHEDTWSRLRLWAAIDPGRCRCRESGGCEQPLLADAREQRRRAQALRAHR
jgi:hypothetical protein